LFSWSRSPGPGLHLPGPLRGRGPPAALHEDPGQRGPRGGLGGGLGPGSGLRPRQVHAGRGERERGVRRRRPVRPLRDAVLQRGRGLGAAALRGGEGGAAPGEEEGAAHRADGARHRGGALPAARGAHALRLLLRLRGVPLPGQRVRVRHHGPELQRGAAALHRQEGPRGRRRRVLRAPFARGPRPRAVTTPPRCDHAPLEGPMCSYRPRPRAVATPSRRRFLTFWFIFSK